MAFTIRIAIAFFFITLGYIASLYRDISMRHPILERKIDNINIIAKVYDLDYTGNKTRLYLEDIKYYHSPSSSLVSSLGLKSKTWLATPEMSSWSLNKFYTAEQDKQDSTLSGKETHFIEEFKVRITSLSSPNVKIGDIIAARISLISLPSSPFPGSFDFAQHSYFKGLGAIGYATGKIKIIDSSNEDQPLRKIISARLRQVIPSPYGDIAAGMLVGESSSIPIKDYDAVRIAGTAHLIAISGMHIVIICSIIFLLVRLIFRAIAFYYPECYLYYNWQKFAALSAIIASCSYLILSGMPISGQRAVVSSSIVFFAIILDLRHNSWRALSIAALVLLILMPEMLFNPSLQMSFAACLALITLWRYSFSRLSHKNQIIRYIYSLILASVFAGLATAPFIAYHFNTFAPYSLLANLICVPLTDFVIMPIGIITILLMPIGLEIVPAFILQYAIKIFLYVSHLVASLPKASIHIPTPPSISWVLLIIGLILLLLPASLTIFSFSNRLRKLNKHFNKKVVGITFLSTAVILIFITNKLPKLIISEQVFAINYQDQLILSSRQKSKHTRKIWEQKLGKHNFADVSLKQAKLPSCDDKLCLVKLITSSSEAPTNKLILITNFLSHEKHYQDLYKEITDENQVLDIVINLQESIEEDLKKYKNILQFFSVEDIRKLGNYIIY